MSRRLRVLTWQVHGNYLYYLSQTPHDFYLVADASRKGDRAGRTGSLPWGGNVHDAPVEAVPSMRFDCVLYQSRRAWLEDRHSVLSEAQRRLPALYLEHDPPQEHPTGTRHPVQDRNTLLVHVTPFNQLMWDSGDSPNVVIEHGVKLITPAAFTGELARGIVVVNNLASRGRRLGADVFAAARAAVPLELYGMGAESCGGAGELSHHELPLAMAAHRFFFNPIRYTSLGLAVIEAMMVGVPVVALATTELVTVIENGRSGYIDTRLDRLIQGMRALLRDAGAARELGGAGRRTACERFNIQRFAADWDRVLRSVTG